MITWKWKVRALTLRPTLDSLNNVVAVVHWSTIFINEEDPDPEKREIQMRYNYTYLTPPEGNPDAFIAYENLTEADCINWVKSILGPKTVAEIEAEGQHRVLLAQGVSGVNTYSFPWQQNIS